MRRFTVLWLAILSGLACSSVADDEAPLPTWTVSSAPAVSIGLADGDTAYLFSRIATARWTESGQVVIADGGASIIRLFDGAGGFLKQFGGSGEGPGEFQSLRSIWPAAGDSLGAWDSGARRLTFIDLISAEVRTAPITLDPGSSESVNLDLMAGTRADGSVAIGSLSFGSPEGTGADRVTVEHFDSDGQHLGRLAETTGMVRGPRAPLPFSPFVYFAVTEDALYSTNGWLAQALRWSPDGLSDIAFPTTDHDIDDAWIGLAERVRQRENPFYMAQLENASSPDTIPQLAGLVVDSEGLLWSKRYDPSSDALWLDGGTRIRGGEWWVVGPESGPVARVVLPDDVVPLEIHRERILGLHIDSSGVERIVIHALNRSSGGPNG